MLDLLYHCLSLNHSYGLVGLPLGIVHGEEKQHEPGLLMELHCMPAPARVDCIFTTISVMGRSESKSYQWAKLEVEPLHGLAGSGKQTGWSGTFKEQNCITDEEVRERGTWTVFSEWAYSVKIFRPCRYPPKGSHIEEVLSNQAARRPLLWVLGSLSPAAPVLAYWVHLQTGHDTRKEALKELNNSLPLSKAVYIHRGACAMASLPFS